MCLSEVAYLFCSTYEHRKCHYQHRRVCCLSQVYWAVFCSIVHSSVASEELALYFVTVRLDTVPSLDLCLRAVAGTNVCTVSSGRGETLPFDSESLRGYVSCADRIVLARLRLFDVLSPLAAPLGRSGPARSGSCNANLTFFLEPAGDANGASCPPTAFNTLRTARTSLLSSDSSSLSLEVDNSIVRSTSAIRVRKFSANSTLPSTLQMLDKHNKLCKSHSGSFDLQQ